jgi:hypothetical protein
MATAESGPQPLEGLRRAGKSGSGQLLDAIDDAIDASETDPGSTAVRRQSFGDGLGVSRPATGQTTG